MAVKRKKEPNYTLLVIGGLALAGVALGLREAVVTVGGGNADGDDVRAGLQDILDLYGRDYAETIEQMMRKETRHFDSLQWKEGNTAGMEARTTSFPFGWSSLVDFATVYNLPPSSFGTYEMRENNTGIIKRFIRFPNERAFTNFLAWFIKNVRDGRPGKWYSLNEQSARRYESELNTIIPRIVDTL